MSELISHSYEIFVEAVGVLLLADWFAFLPFFSEAFRLDERKPAGPADLPWAIALASVWFAAIGALLLGGAFRLFGLLVLFLIFRHYFIQTRWSSIRRGFGAPGFMSHWIVFYLMLIESARWLHGLDLAEAVLRLMRFDFALIILCAGAYKMLSGYFRNAGMEYGQVNPMWGYFWPLFKHFNPRSPLQQFMNLMASGVELAAGALMLVPATTPQVIGGTMISLSFVYVGCLIRLGRLAFLMVVIPAIFLPGVAASIPASPIAPILPDSISGYLVLGTQVLMVVMVIVKVTQYVNFFANRKLPSPIQEAITWFANFWPIIIWRVFTVDVTNFFVRIAAVLPSGEKVPLLDESSTYSYGDWRHLRRKLRFLHVTESIALTSVFTTLKYFSSKPELFRDKLLRYSLSLSNMLPDPAARLCFEYVSIQKTATGFAFVPVGIFDVDLAAGTVVETKHVADYDFTRPAEHSPVRESSGAGTYTRKAS